METKSIEPMKDWIHHTFEGGCTITDEFKDFFKDYKKFIKVNLPDKAKLSKIKIAHFSLYGFIERESKYVYFSIMDVRHFPYSWADNILIRRADNLKDFTGKENNYTHLYNFKDDVEKLLI